MSEMWENKGWVFLILAIILFGIGFGIQFGTGQGLAVAGAGFFFAALICGACATV